MDFAENLALMLHVAILGLYLVSKRGKLMWQSEVIGPQRLCLASSRYMQFLVQWLVDMFDDQAGCDKVAIEWMKKCASSFEPRTS